MNIHEYLKELDDKVKVAYSLAAEARRKGLDPLSSVEIPLATNLAERATGLISIKYPQLKNEKLVLRIKELEKEYGFLDPAVCIKIAEEIAKEKFCKFQSFEEALDAGLRVAFAYFTLGVVSSPLEGYSHFEIKKNAKNEDYISAHFSGPIRSAGTTATSLFVFLIDYLRRLFGYAEYDITQPEIKRSITEVYDYHEYITNLQYLPTEKELEFLLSKLPLQVDGTASEEREVSNYKDLPRISTNQLRNGVCLVLCESLCQKSFKLLKILKNLKAKGFDIGKWMFIEELVELQKKQAAAKTEVSDVAVYIKDLVAGRPVLTHPSRSGGFRLRYGRCRISGDSSMAMHPATMQILKNFIATGTQLRYEGPGKSSAMVPCDSIDGPIVKLKNGSVVFLSNEELAKKYAKDIGEIIYLGDFLVNYGEFFNRGKKLQKPGYVEEWWFLELEKALREKDIYTDLEDIYNVSFSTALDLSEIYKIPMHPRFIFYWSQIEYEEFLALLDWLQSSKVDKKLILPWNKTESERFRKGKRALELLGVEHEVATENVILNEDNSKALFINLGMSHKLIDKENYPIADEIAEISRIVKTEEEKSVLGLVNKISQFKIKDKAGSFIGARMGRPEKAKLRKLVGSPSVLFPVGAEGGRFRSVNEAVELGSIKADFPIYYCKKCEKETIYFICENCGEECSKLNYCSECGQKFSFAKCPEHGKSQPYMNKRIDSKYYFKKAVERLELEPEEVPALVKGVKGTSNTGHVPENLAKGMLRALFNLNVNKDGTIRYDITELSMTHFRAKEIGTSLKKLRELGYTKDIYGEDLENENQLLELKPQDIILPCCPESEDEKADDVFMSVANFIDMLLIKFYKMKPFYNVRKREDLVGHLLVGIAPHTSAGIVSRIIGFSKTIGLFAHPMWHSAQRRDCLDYNSYIPIKKNDSWEIVKIGEFIERLNPTEMADNFGTLKKQVSDIYTFGNPGQGAIKEITKHQPTKMLKFYLEGGREIELTGTHKLYLKGKQEIIAKDAKIGDKLMVSYKKEIEEKDIKEIFLPEIFKGREDVMIRDIKIYLEKFGNLSRYKNFWHRDSFPIKLVEEFLKKHNKTLKDLPSYAKISIKRDNLSIPTRISLENELLEVIGFYIAEGYARKKTEGRGHYNISIASCEDELKGRIKKVMEKYFGLSPSENHKDHLTFSSRIVYELFVEYLKLGKKAREKRVPSLFIDLKKEKIAALLRGYFEGDGSVSLTEVRVNCDTVSEGLKYDLSFILSRFGIFTKFHEYEKEPGPQVRAFYIKKKRQIPKFRITKIIIPSNFVKRFWQIGFISERKNKILKKLCESEINGMKIDFDEDYVYPKIKRVEEIGEKGSYCFNVIEEHNFFANDILVHNCEGDETSILFLLDALLNASREFLPAHRGSTQDAILVISSRLVPNEIDDMAFDIDVVWKYPLELYEAAEMEKAPYEIKIEQLKHRLGTDKAYYDFGFTHDVSDINCGVRYSAYKSIANMKDKVKGQMEIATMIRAVDASDVAKLVITRHFIRDIRGNLRKFSQQEFRCTSCNEKYRRPPLSGICKCGGNIIFTINEGGIVKYLEPALQLAEKYNVPAYVKQSLDLTRSYIESIFGREKEKQESVSKWF